MRTCTWLFVNSSEYKAPTSTSTESSKSCQDGANALKCAGTSLTNDCTAVQQMGCIQCRTDRSPNNSTCSRRSAAEPTGAARRKTALSCRPVFASSDRYLQECVPVQADRKAGRNAVRNSTRIVALWFMVHTQTAACRCSLLTYLLHGAGSFLRS
jgi:hypothetical protein